MRQLSKQIIAFLLVVSATFAATPSITFISSTRGVGIVVTDVPNNLKLSTRRNGNLLLLTLTSDELNSYPTLSYNGVVQNHEVSQIAARITGNHLEIVFSMDNPQKYSAIEYKAGGGNKGMILLSRNKSSANEVKLKVETIKKSTKTAKKAPVVTPNVAPKPKAEPKQKVTPKVVQPKIEKPAAKATKKPVATKLPDMPSKKEQQDESTATSGTTTIIVTEDETNVRTSPSTLNNDNLVRKVAFGTKFVSDEKRGPWYHIILDDGTKAWVHQSVAQDSSSITADVWDAIYNKEIENKQEYALKEKKVAKPIEPKVVAPVKVEGAFSLTDTPVESVSEDELEKINSRSKDVAAVVVPEKVIITYHEYGRDPFIPLDNKNNIYIDESLPNVDVITLVGILYDDAHGIGLFEETSGKNRGTSFTLQKGDAVIGGKVLQVFPNKVVFLMQEFDYSYTVEKVLKSQRE